MFPNFGIEAEATFRFKITCKHRCAKTVGFIIHFNYAETSVLEKVRITHCNLAKSVNARARLANVKFPSEEIRFSALPWKKSD